MVNYYYILLSVKTFPCMHLKDIVFSNITETKISLCMSEQRIIFLN